MGSVGSNLETGPPYPPFLGWEILTTPHHQLIFPEGCAEGAYRTAGITSVVQEYIEEDYGIEIPPYPLVLNTSADRANGWFGLAPRRSTWYSYPSQNRFAGAVDWYTLLAVHEGRHAVQFGALDQGFIRGARLLYGDYGWSFFSLYSVPLWFYEGDAILAETAFTSGGRGRSAAFHREILALAASGDRPSYQQAYLGSYSTHFPSHYHLGYPLVSYIRLKYGEDVWNEVLRRTADWAFLPLRFHGMVKKVTRRSVGDLYGEMLDYLDVYRREVLAEKQFTAVRSMTGETKEWVNFLPVSFTSRGRQIFAVRYGDHLPTELVRLGAEGRAEVITPFHGKDRWVDVDSGGMRAVWAEEVSHPLWTEVSDSRLVLYDIKRDRREFLGVEKHLQAPVFSPDGSKVAALEVRPGGTGSLVLIDASEGRRLLSTTPELTELTAGGRGPDLLHPAWSEEGKEIALIAQKGGRSYLLEYGIGKKSWRILLGPLEEQLDRLEYAGDYLLYGSDFGGSEGIYAAHRETGRSYLVAERPFAAAYPLADMGVTVESKELRGRLVFADYTAKGFRLVEMMLDERNFTPLTETERGRIGYADSVLVEMGADRAVGQVQKAACATQREAQAGEVLRRYRPSDYLLHFHSWGVMPAGDGRGELFLQSEDPLGILSFRPYAGFDYPARTWFTGFQGVYRGIFPVLNFSAAGDVKNPGDPDGEEYGFTGSLGLEAPINLSRGIWRRELSFAAVGFLRAEEAEEPAVTGEMEAILPIGFSAGFSNANTAVSPADFSAAPAQYSLWSWYRVPWQKLYAGQRLEQRGGLHFPGFFRHHRLSFGLDTAWEEGAEIPLNFQPLRPRGYPVEWSRGYPFEAVAGIQYTLPLGAPDLALGNVYYLKGILFSVFHDAGFVLEDAAMLSSAAEAEGFHSSGVELLFQQAFFTWPLVFEGGIRLIYRWRDESLRVEDTIFTIGIEW